MQRKKGYDLSQVLKTVDSSLHYSLLSLPSTLSIHIKIPAPGVGAWQNCSFATLLSCLSLPPSHADFTLTLNYKVHFRRPNRPNPLSHDLFQPSAGEHEGVPTRSISHSQAWNHSRSQTKVRPNIRSSLALRQRQR
jgi:hypothetical protein